MIQTQEFRICDVHRLVDFDTESKWCSYCGLCDAWICKDCQPRWDRRLRAAVKRIKEPTYKGVPNYEETLRRELENVRT